MHLEANEVGTATVEDVEELRLLWGSQSVAEPFVHASCVAESDHRSE